MSGWEQKSSVAAGVLKPFFQNILSVEGSQTPLLSDLAASAAGGGFSGGLFCRRIERRYLRLCQLQKELSNLNLKKAPQGQSAEDFIFSSIDFSRYGEIEKARFENIYLGGLSDFSRDFLKKNFDLDAAQAEYLILQSYKEGAGAYILQNKTPLALSLMRTLETSLETLPVFTLDAIQDELDRLPFAVKGGAGKIFPLLVLGLEGKVIPHKDGMAAKLFISPNGDLSGTFQPGGKSWTLVLIPGALDP